MHTELLNIINKVIDYIEQNLNEEHQLEKLAQIANLSKFHFHRTFKIVTKETPNEYIIRKRLEKITSQLIYGTDKTISDLSFYYGFKNLSSFSRVFKKKYGFSASQLKRRVNDPLKKSLIENSKIGKTLNIYEDYICNSTKIRSWMDKFAEVSIQNLPEMKLAYVRHWGSPDTIYKAFDELLKKYEINDMDIKNGSKYFITLFHDNPSLTIDYKIQQSACVSIDDIEMKRLKNVAVLKIPPQKYVIGKFDLLDSEFEMAWNSLIIWLNDRNMQSVDGYRFEIFLNKSIIDQKSISYKVEIAISVK